MIVSFSSSDFRLFFVYVGFGSFADFKIPFMSGRKLSASVCGSMGQASSVATIYYSIGICFGAIS